MRKLSPCLVSVFTLFLALPLANAGETVGGHVFSNGVPVEKAEVRWIKFVQKNESARNMFNHYGQYEVVAATFTDAEGVFAFPVDQLEQWYRFSVLKGDMGAFEVSWNATTGPLKIELAPLAKATGRVIGPPEADISKIRISLQGASSSNFKKWDQEPVPVKPNGSFEMLLDGGKHNLNSRYKSALVAEGPSGFGGIGPEIPVEDEERNADWSIENHTIQLKRLAHGSLILEDQQGKPLVHHLIHLSFREPYLGGRKTPWSPFVIHGLTDSRGVLEFEGAWPGWIEGTISGGRYSGEFEIDLSGAGEDPIEIRRVIETKDHKKWTFQAVDSKGQPVQDAILVTYCYTSDQMMTRVELAGGVDENGAVELKDLPTVPWGIAFYKPELGAAQYCSYDSNTKDWLDQYDSRAFVMGATPGEVTIHIHRTKKSAQTIEIETRAMNDHEAGQFEKLYKKYQEQESAGAKSRQ
jgi:hypothetical protein